MNHVLIYIHSPTRFIVHYPITLVCPAQNESSWVEISIRSIIELVDELIFIDDNSIDETLEIVKSLSSEYPNINIMEAPNVKGRDRFSSIFNMGFSEAKNNWVMNWAGDIVAFTEGRFAIQNLFEKALENEDMWDSIVYKTPNLAGDIYHQPKGKEISAGEPYLVKKGHMKFGAHVDPKHGHPDNRFPKEGTRFCWTHKEHHFLHLNTIKPLEKLAYRVNMGKYLLREREYDEMGYWEWYALFLREMKGPISPDEVKKTKEELISQVRNSPRDLVPYNPETFGKHPKILIESEIWKNYKIVERDDGKFTLDYPRT